MRLNEFMERMRDIEALAKSQNANPEIRIAVLPKFPSESTINDNILCTLEGKWQGFTPRTKKHFVYIGEDSDQGYLTGDAAVKFGWYDG